MRTASALNIISFGIEVETNHFNQEDITNDFKNKWEDKSWKTFSLFFITINENKKLFSHEIAHQEIMIKHVFFSLSSIEAN